MKQLSLAMVVFVLITLAPALMPNAEAQADDAALMKVLIGDAVSNVGSQYDHVKNAITRFRNNDIKNAEAYLGRAKKKFPKLPPEKVMMAKLFFAAKNAAAGRAMLEQAVVFNPSDPEAYLIFAQVALQERRTTSAAVLYATAQQRVEKYTENARRKRKLQIRCLQGLSAVEQTRGLVAGDKGAANWAAAKKHLDQWIVLDPDTAVARQHLGQVLFKMKQYREAYTALKKANQLDKETAESEVIMGQLYERDGNRTQATKFMNAAAKSRPKDLKTRLAIANWAISTNQLEVALTHSEAAIKLDPKSLQTKLIRGMVARLRGDSATAERYFEAAHLQAPGNFSTSNNLALVLCEQKDKTKQSRAVQFAVMNVQRFPTNGNSRVRFEAASTLGWVYYQLGRPNDAAAALQAVLRAGSLGPDSSYYVARILHDQHKNEQAIKFLERVIKTEAPFVHRKKAQQLLNTLQNKPK